MDEHPGRWHAAFLPRSPHPHVVFVTLVIFVVPSFVRTASRGPPSRRAPSQTVYRKQAIQSAAATSGICTVKIERGTRSATVISRERSLRRVDAASPSPAWRRGRIVLVPCRVRRPRCRQTTGRNGAARPATARAPRPACRRIGPRERTSPGRRRSPNGGRARRPSSVTRCFVTTETDASAACCCGSTREPGRIVWKEQVGSGRANRKQPGQKRASKFHNSAQHGQPVPGDGWPARHRPLRQRRPGLVHFAGTAAMEAEPRRRLRLLHDLVGTRQQPGPLRRRGDLRLHAGLARGDRPRASAATSSPTRSARASRSWTDSCGDRGRCRGVRLVHHAGLVVGVGNVRR